MKKIGIKLLTIVIIITLSAMYLICTKFPSLKENIIDIRIRYQENYLADSSKIDNEFAITSEEEINEIKKLYNGLSLRKSLFSDRGFEKNGKLSCITVIFFAKNNDKENDNVSLAIFENGKVYINGSRYINLFSTKDNLDIYNYFKKKIK